MDKSNPEIGMSGNSFEDAQPTNTGSKEFFDQLDSQINGGIADNLETQDLESGPEQVTHSISGSGSNTSANQSEGGTDWEKRYKDSSREAVKWRDAYKNVEQFVPVLDAMKKDSGLVEHVRNYLVSGGQPAQSIQNNLGLGEDFMFDANEAMSDPNSDSAKVMNAHVDQLVQRRIAETVNTEKQRALAVNQKNVQQKAFEEYKQKHNMTDEQFEDFKKRASEHTVSLDDIGYILNRSQVNQNVAQNTKQDMLNQMKNVRSMPTSASGANSQGEAKSNDRQVFDNILGLNQGVDNLFG